MEGTRLLKTGSNHGSWQTLYLLLDVVTWNCSSFIDREGQGRREIFAVFCESLFVKGYKNGQLRIVTGFVFWDCIAFPQRPLGSFITSLCLSVAVLGLVRLLQCCWRDDRSRKAGHLICVLKIGCAAPPPLSTWPSVSQVWLKSFISELDFWPSFEKYCICPLFQEVLELFQLFSWGFDC